MAATEVGLVNLRDSDLVLADARDDVRGMTVLDPYGHRLGEVDDLIIDELERRMRMLVVTSGGILGLGESKRLVPVEAINRIDEAVHVDRSHEHVYQDQGYDPPSWRTALLHRRLRQVRISSNTVQLVPD